MANEKRLIDANAIEAKIEKNFRRLVASQNKPDLAAALSYVGDLIIEAPTVDAVEVVHGRWIDVNGRKYLGSYCSHCNKWCDYKYNYCPNCGAKMNGGNEDV
jgi:hypothetical protein